MQSAQEPLLHSSFFFHGVATEMTSAQRRARTTGSAKWEPDQFFESWESKKQLPEDHDLRTSIISAFNLSDRDNYVYHAIASVTLSEVQEAISNGSENGLHAWYLDGEGKAVGYLRDLWYQMALTNRTLS